MHGLDGVSETLARCYCGQKFATIKDLTDHMIQAEQADRQRTDEGFTLTLDRIQKQLVIEALESKATELTQINSLTLRQIAVDLIHELKGK